MNKKGITTSITWAIATIIIAVGAIVLLIFVGNLNTSELIFGKSDNGLEISQQTNANPFIETNMQTLLNYEVELEDDERQFIELIEKNEIEEGEIAEAFKKTSKNFLTTIFPFPTDKWTEYTSDSRESARRYFHPYWISVLNEEDPVSSATSSAFFFGGTDCYPSTDSSIVWIRHLDENKKIILCVDRRYYKAIEGEI